MKYNNNLRLDQTAVGRNSGMSKNKQINIYLESHRLKITFFDLLHIFNYTFGQKTTKYNRLYGGSMRSARKLL